MRYVASREEMQQIDAYSINTMGIPGIVLMEKAALALEEVFLERVPTKSRVLIVTEKGNNGGCVLYTSTSPRDGATTRMPASA